jgi:OmpA-OmpF porin, OOP family
MKSFLVAWGVLFSLAGYSQITTNPRINKKSTSDVFINKIEITADKTVVSMQFVAKTAKEMLKQYFEENPDDKQKFEGMNPMMRSMILQQMMQNTGGSTISFQPSSFIKTPDGRKFKFLKAFDIPISPERKEAEPGKKYFFKVHFEKLPPGYETIDLVENGKDRSESYTYWNFFGISINNPSEDQALKKESASVETDVSMFRLYGKVIDAVTNTPISARILGFYAQSQSVFDSVQTSKSGTFEFLVDKKDILLKISATGYQGLEEGVDIRFFVDKGSLQKDVYLEPVSSKVENNSLSAPQADATVGLPVDGVKKVFKLDKVYFNLGEDKVLPESFQQLNGLADFLKQNDKIKIQIEGHTDNQGDSKLNKKLSVERAYNVRQYLIEKGIAGNRIKFVGYGDTQPVSENSDEESRKKNRRVEYKIIEE